MRKIALLAVVAFAAACGSSTTDPGVRDRVLRVANLSRSVTAIDYCIRRPAATYSAPVMAGPRRDAGLVYGGVKVEEMIDRKYVTYTAGSYTIGVFNKGLPVPPARRPGLHPDVPSATASHDGRPRRPDRCRRPRARPRTSTRRRSDATKVAIRFINDGLPPG